MKKTRILLMIASAAMLATSLSFAAKKEIEFTGQFTGPAGLPPGPLPQICAERTGTCGSDPAVIESCGASVGRGTLIGAFEGEAFLCINTQTGEFFNGYYEFRGANGSTMYGPFFGQNVPLFPGGVPGPEGPSGFVGFGQWAVDGGTGLFQDATSGFNPARVSQPTTTGVPPHIFLGGKIEIEKDVD